MPRLWVLAAVVGAAATLPVLLAPAGAAGDTIVSADPSARQVAAGGGFVVWSRRDPATGRFRLVLHSAGIARDLPVDPGVRPFLADVSEDPRAHPVVTFSRCNTGGCRRFAVDLKTGVLRRLRLPDDSGVTHPAVFANTWMGVRGDAVVARRAGRTLRLRRSVRETVTSVSVRTAAAAWSVVGFSEGIDLTTDTQLFTARLPRGGKARACRVASAFVDGEGGQVLSDVHLVGDQVWWGQLQITRGAGVAQARVMRSGVPGRRCEPSRLPRRQSVTTVPVPGVAPGAESAPFSMAVDARAGAVYVTTGEGVRQLTELAFEPVR